MLISIIVKKFNSQI